MLTGALTAEAGEEAGQRGPGCRAAASGPPVLPACFQSHSVPVREQADWPAGDLSPPVSGLSERPSRMHTCLSCVSPGSGRPPPLADQWGPESRYRFTAGGKRHSLDDKRAGANYKVKGCGSQAGGGSGKRGSEPHVVDGGEGTESTVSRQLP